MPKKYPTYLVNSPRYIVPKTHFYPEDVPADAKTRTVTNQTTGDTHVILPATKTCNGWRLRAKTYCSQVAGMRTQHRGTGRCWLHDMSPAHAGSSRYRHIEHTAVGVLANEILSIDDDPTNITEELAMARAIFSDWIERYALWSDALLAWHASFYSGEKEPKPLKILDISDAHRQLKTIGTLAQQLQDSRLRDAVSQGELVEILREVSTVVELSLTTCPHCHGKLDAVLDLIRKGWTAIQLWGRNKRLGKGGEH